MMAFSFREFTNFLDEGERLPEIAKPEAPLNVASLFWQLPIRGLCMKALNLLARKRGNSSATGSTGFVYKLCGHIAFLSWPPSPAVTLANRAAMSAAKPTRRLTVTAASG
jgi:hypothetical protein